MPTAEHCRAMAAEADRLATIVSYTRDKVRLREQAKSWRDQADALEARGAANACETEDELGAGVRRWFKRRTG